ncbi:hypothetical protein K438DRAFT_1768209 [Mycena galopus ATCC 62051]|nr:hypothetical protein K438DRAFT_1768209 [Mycena galopus ATCC 62051]
MIFGSTQAERLSSAAEILILVFGGVVAYQRLMLLPGTDPLGVFVMVAWDNTLSSVECGTGPRRVWRTPCGIIVVTAEAPPAVLRSKHTLACFDGGARVGMSSGPHPRAIPTRWAPSPTLRDETRPQGEVGRRARPGAGEEDSLGVQATAKEEDVSRHCPAVAVIRVLRIAPLEPVLRRVASRRNLQSLAMGILNPISGVQGNNNLDVEWPAPADNDFGVLKIRSCRLHLFDSGPGHSDPTMLTNSSRVAAQQAPTPARNRTWTRHAEWSHLHDIDRYAECARSTRDQVIQAVATLFSLEARFRIFASQGWEQQFRSWVFVLRDGAKYSWDETLRQNGPHLHDTDGSLWIPLDSGAGQKVFEANGRNWMYLQGWVSARPFDSGPVHVQSTATSFSLQVQLPILTSSRLGVYIPLGVCISASSAYYPVYNRTTDTATWFLEIFPPSAGSKGFNSAPANNVP